MFKGVAKVCTSQQKYVLLQHENFNKDNKPFFIYEIITHFFTLTAGVVLGFQRTGTDVA